MEVKFEEQFKHRDESNVNAPCAAHRKDSKKPYSTEAFVVSHNSIYRRTWQSGNHRHSQHRTARAVKRGAGDVVKNHDPGSALATTQMQ
jgi:hypothetical protein